MLLKTIRGSSHIYALSNHTTLSQTQPGAIVALQIVLAKILIMVILAWNHNSIYHEVIGVLQRRVLTLYPTSMIILYIDGSTSFKAKST
jgi:hypothetical protein